ncbi:hypothetical protein [Sphingomonas yabuuchiae]|uniref:hypothetical protein n=1 Tax=Sphingomonas yabuuchiae TaxID=172044 RepID=UPI001FCD7DDC|nr:hypothetical protein [Sphingomonas yabuuchiae]
MRTAPGPKIPATDKAPDGAAAGIVDDEVSDGGTGTGVWAISGAAKVIDDSETKNPDIRQHDRIDPPTPRSEASEPNDCFQNRILKSA